MTTPVQVKLGVVGKSEVKAAFKDVLAAGQTTAQGIEKSYDRIAKAATKAAKTIKKSSEEVSSQETKSTKKTTDSVVKDYERRAKAAEASSQRQIAASQRAAKEVAKNRAATMRGPAGGGGSSSGLLGPGSMAGGFAAAAAAAAGAAIVAATGAALRQSMKLGDISNRLSISARGAGEKFVDKDVLRKEFEQVAASNPGMKAEDVAIGTQGFVSKTGDLDSARKFSGTFATVAQASGAEYKDVANAAADLMQKFDIKSMKDMQDALATLHFQGKQGAFELKDAAAQFAKLSAAASRFNIGKGSQAVATLGGLTQIARTSTGSPEEAATAVEQMFSQLTAKADKLKAQGVNVFDAKGQSRDIQNVLIETIANVGGTNLAKKKAGLQEVFGESGIKAISPLIAKYEETFSKTKGTEEEKTKAAVASLRMELEKSISVVGSFTELEKDAAQAQTDSSAQLTAAWESLVAKITDSVTPAVEEMTPSLLKIADLLASPLADGIGMVVDSLAGLVEFLEKLGIFSIFSTEKIETHESKAKKAEAELAEFNKDLPTGPLTEEQAAKRAELKATVDQEHSLAITEDPEIRAKNKAAREMTRKANKDSKGGLGIGVIDRAFGAITPTNADGSHRTLSGAIAESLPFSSAAVPPPPVATGGKSTAETEKGLDATTAKLAMLANTTQMLNDALTMLGRNRSLADQ